MTFALSFRRTLQALFTSHSLPSNRCRHRGQAAAWWASLRRSSIIQLPTNPLLFPMITKGGLNAGLRSLASRIRERPHSIQRGSSRDRRHTASEGFEGFFENAFADGLNHHR